MIEDKTLEARESAGSRLLPVGLAAVAVLAIVVAVTLLGHGRSAGPAHSMQNDGYGANLQFSRLQMSESTSLSGGKSTFIDGEVRNAGGITVSAATVQVTFANDEALPPEIRSRPLLLIRTHEPYVDTQPVGEAPLTAGSTREFRLIFEGSGSDGVGRNWNQQLPVIRAEHVYTLCNPCR